jgi:hypothetical protein
LQPLGGGSIKKSLKFVFRALLFYDSFGLIEFRESVLPACAQLMVDCPLEEIRRGHGIFLLLEIRRNYFGRMPQIRAIPLGIRES